MRAWLPRVLLRIRRQAVARRVRLTQKARFEIAALGFDEEDACDVLAKLTAHESAGRVLSKATREWLYLFKPNVTGTLLYLKLVLRRECVVISFHEDENGHEQDDP